jgi:two-component system response regulator
MAAPLIFLVDDDPNDQELARIALRSSGVQHRLEIARDGAEAIERLRQGALQGGTGLPYLMLLDLKLPKMTGLEVLERVRGAAATKLLPVVVFTSSLEEKDVIDSYELGANAYIRKPVDFDEYSKLIADLVAFWIVRNQAPPGIASPRYRRWEPS